MFTKQPVLALQGLKGTKLRVLPTPAFMDTFKAMGRCRHRFRSASCTWPSRRASSTEHDPATVLASKFDEVVKSCWQSQHVFAAMTVVMGRRALDRIPANLRPRSIARWPTPPRSSAIAAQKADRPSRR